MSDIYRSPYEAYPFLSERSDDLRCDFELLTDEMASGTGKLRAMVMHRVNSSGGPDPWLCDELSWVCEMIYNLNPTLRTSLTITDQEFEWLERTVDRLGEQVDRRCGGFVLPMGTEAACEAHLLRVQAKKLVRLIYRYIELGGEVPDRLLDIANLLSQYYFYLALSLNEAENVSEVPFSSRNYD